jgi:cytochrome c oxidase cbb3-type subunit 3
MSEDKDRLIEHHEYDGIKEYDNPLPNWWLVTFLLTIIYGAIYWLHYESDAAPTQLAELKEDLHEIELVQKSRPKSNDSEEDLQKHLSSVEAMVLGKDVFAAKCSACHGNDLQGVIGPNLTDDYWLHGKGKLIDIVGTIRKGVLDKGMPTWDGQIKDEELKAVAVFIMSKRGSNPANPKAPQGEKVVTQ